MGDTIRSSIKRRVWRLAAIGVGGWLLFALSAFAAKGDLETPLAICGFVMFGGAILFMQRIECPKCCRTLGQTIAMPIAFGGRKAPNYCPFCGVSLDTPCP
jgi:hypothetical protein